MIKRVLKKYGKKQCGLRTKMGAYDTRRSLNPCTSATFADLLFPISSEESWQTFVSRKGNQPLKPSQKDKEVRK